MTLIATNPSRHLALFARFCDYWWPMTRSTQLDRESCFSWTGVFSYFAGFESLCSVAERVFLVNLNIIPFCKVRSLIKDSLYSRVAPASETQFGCREHSTPFFTQTVVLDVIRWHSTNRQTKQAVAQFELLVKTPKVKCSPSFIPALFTAGLKKLFIRRSKTTKLFSRFSKR